MSTIASERGAVQNPFLRYAKEAGWTYLAPDDALRLLAHPEANVFHVTDEWTFSNGTPPDIRTDINFLVNGIPLLVVETSDRKAL